jgi:hypothetical protein
MESLDSIQKRKDLFSHYYDNFEKHLADERIAKASEFLWGSISCLIDAIAITYGKTLGTHSDTKYFIKWLSEETNQPNIYDLFKKAESLHANFYHNFLDKERLEIEREEMDRLIEQLGKILEARIILMKSSFVEGTPAEESIL